MLGLKQKRMLARIIFTSVMVVALAFVSVGGVLRFVLYLSIYVLIGYDVLRKAGYGIINGRVFDENFLMVVATVGVFALAIAENSGDYEEATAVMLFYQIGEFLQKYAVGKSRRSISELMDIRPDYANVEREGELVRVDPSELGIGSVIIVQPGERVPLDGVVAEGVSYLDTSALTGESMPRECVAGSEVISGCINMSGVLKIRTTKEFGESTVSRILDLVENSSSNKSHSEDFISKFARVYTPVVCYGALALAVLPPLVNLLAGSTADFGVWVYRALTFLVISCPCALVISIPLSFFAGIGGAGGQGILVKGSDCLEALSKVDTVVLDKTGTLTKGVLEVVGIHHSSYPGEMLMEYAALAESSSSHPVSRSIRQAYGGRIDRTRVGAVKEISGHGVVAVVDGHDVAVGNSRLMSMLGIDSHPCHCTGTVVHVGIDGRYAGHIVVSDAIKATSRHAVDTMRSTGIKQIVMLTGDSSEVAGMVAGELGIDSVFSGLLPDDKVRKVEDLMGNEEAHVAFVGDGINDAPVLARADVGIAMGGLGSDAAVEAADVVIMDDDPDKIGKSVRIARKCMGIVYQNIVFALSVKLAFLALGAFGIANMWMAVFADVGVMILAVLNAMRAMSVRNL